MDAIATYIIKSIITSGILFGYYQVALRNKKFHSYNRFYLLGAVVISLVIPALNLKWYTIKAPQQLPLGSMLVSTTASAVTNNGFHFTTGAVLLACAVLVSVILLTVLLLKIVWIYNVKHKSKAQAMNGYTLIETPVKQAPFSFLDNLFWKQGTALDDSNGNKIFRHELTHIRQKHTYDKLFAQVVVCLCWMNPFYWLMQRELNMIHEFIADDGCINEGDTEAFALMLLQSHNEGRYLNPAHSFFHSPIKRRLIMITTSKHTPYSYARRVLALPLTAVVLAMLSFTVGNAQTKDKVLQKEVELKLLDEKKEESARQEKILKELYMTYNKQIDSAVKASYLNTHPKDSVGAQILEKKLLELKINKANKPTVDSVRFGVSDMRDTAVRQIVFVKDMSATGQSETDKRNTKPQVVLVDGKQVWPKKDTLNLTIAPTKQ
jgi:hypothetical protein